MGANTPGRHLPSLMGRTATRSASLVPPTAGSNRQPTASESNTPPDGLAHQRKQLPTQIGLQCLNLTNLMACARCRAQCIPAMPTRPSGRSATQDLIALTVRYTAMYICTAESIYTRGAIVRPYFVSSLAARSTGRAATLTLIALAVRLIALAVRLELVLGVTARRRSSARVDHGRVGRMHLLHRAHR